MSFKYILIFVFCSFVVNTSCLAQIKTENVVLITIDGLRWKEVFMGADPDIIRNRKFVKNIEDTGSQFWNDDVNLRRQQLMPFFWKTLAAQGQIYGNRELGNKVNIANRYHFSYPGYNELLTGKPDKQIRGNKKRINPNETILEFANQQSGFEDKVAVFASWDVFHYIISSKRSKILVNAGNDTARVKLTPREKYLNHLQRKTPSPWQSTRFDRFTHSYAKEYLKKNFPRLILIAYGETDEFAHQGKYDQYLQATKNTDDYIRDVWESIQSNDNYRNKTTLIITTDHGRGDGKRSWRNHGFGRPGSNHTWFAVIGPDTEWLGEVSEKNRYYTNQIVKTISTLLKLPYAKGSFDNIILSTISKQ